MKRKIVNLKKSNEIFRFDGTNQNTPGAWVKIDTPENENTRIKVEDNFGSYVWHRKKSNDNVRGKIEDGKGFSFFFTRYAYSDKFKYIDESYVTNDNPGYSSFSASVPFNKIVQLEAVKKEPNLMKILNPSNFILLVVDIPSIKENTTISATYTKKEAILVPYIENKSKIIIEKHDEEYKLTEYGQKWLKDRLETTMKEELYKRFIDGYKQFSEFLSFLKNK